MSRERGILEISANFEVKKASPLDARMCVGKLSDLTDVNVFSVYAYKGMIVSVINDDSNNGLYFLKDLPYTNISNWERIGSNNVGGIQEPYKKDFLESNWVLDNGVYKMSILSSEHKQDNSKYLNVTVYKTDVSNRYVLCDYDIDNNGNVVLYTNVSFNGYCVITDLKKTGNGGWFNEVFIVDSVIKSNNYIDLSKKPMFLMLFQNGLKRVYTFYEINNKRLTFTDNNSINIGDVIDINYIY